MIKAGAAHSANRVAEKAAEMASRAALTQAGISKADAAIVFASSSYRRHYETMARKIREITGAEAIAGASGQGILTQDVEIEKKPGVAVLVLSGDDLEAVSFLLTNLQESNFRAGEKAGNLLIDRKMQPNLMMLFPDPFSFMSHHFFDGFENAYGYVPMIGGAAAEDGNEEKTYQFEGGETAFDAVSGLALSGNFRIETGITRSCQPFGEPLRITRSEGNMIYEMDGRPAYDILLECISHIEFDNPEQIFQRVFLGTPLKNFQTDFLAAPYLIRNIMGVNAKKGVLACIAPVEEGEFVTFTMRDAVMARRDMRNMLEDLAIRVNPSKPVCGFYFNCCARGQALYGVPDADVSMIREIFPGMPLIGFFSYGELAPVDHVNHLHQHSGILTVIVPQ